MRIRQNPKMLAVWERDRKFDRASRAALENPEFGRATRDENQIGVGCRDSLLVPLPPGGSSLARAPVTRGQAEGQEPGAAAHAAVPRSGSLRGWMRRYRNTSFYKILK
jgi:hypothetical protein